MTGYVCYKNGKYKPLNNKKIKVSKADYILLELTSCLLGKAYLKIGTDTYSKIRGMKNIRFSYDFYDGAMQDCDEEDYENCKMHHDYYYDNPNQLFTKISEIIVTEYVLNDTFWVHDSYYSYFFENVKLKYTKKDATIKYSKIDKFFKFIKYNEDKEFSRLISLGKKNYLNTDKVPKGDKKLLVYFIDGLYLEVDKHLFDIDEMSVKTKLKVYEDDGSKSQPHWHCCYNESKFVNIYDFTKFNQAKSPVTDILLSRFGIDVVNQLESNNYYMCFRLVNTIKSINGKKSHKNFMKFISKYFKSVPNDIDDILPIKEE